MNYGWMRMGAMLAGVWLATATGVAGAAGHGHGGADAAGLPASDSVSAKDCWVRHMPASVPSGGFLVFDNTGAQAAVITGVSSPDYGMVMMHETTHKDGMSHMSMIEQASVPAGGALEFKPGAHHLMLEQPRAGLKVGEQVHLDFALADGTGFSVQCQLKSPKDMPGMAEHKHH